MENKPVVMVVEDERAVREHLTALLDTGGYRVISVPTGREAVIVASSHCPELILLDLGLPDMDGMNVIESVRSWSAVPVIVVSSRCCDSDIVAAFDAGADDYVTKPFSDAVLLARVRTALRKALAAGTENSSPGKTFSVDGLFLDFERRIVKLDGERIHLTPIEYKLLTLLAASSGKVLTYRDIRREIWGPYANDNKILRVNMANLRRKLEKNSSAPQYIVTVVGVGYRMSENADN